VWFRILFAVAILFLVGAVATGTLLWERAARKVRTRLEAGLADTRASRVDLEDRGPLPEPVRKYFRTVLEDGRRKVAGARITHRGWFNMSETGEKWVPFSSRQTVIAARPGFAWEARVRLAPGISILVRDAYVGGEGILKASLFGLFTVAECPSTPELAQGELIRFLAESAWVPTILLPGPSLRWEAVDGSRAKVTLIDGETAVSLDFHFSPDGLIEKIRAGSRPRTVGGHTENMPWEARFWAWERHGGMLIPTEGEVAWILPGGPHPYWRARTERIEYESGDGTGVRS